jgi:hypothetical protein
MALPQLYKEITLTRSLPSIRDLTTPRSFLTALNTLVSGNVGSLVKNLVLQDDYSFMLSRDIAKLFEPKYDTLLDYPALLRLPAAAAVGRCTNLQSFTWDLVKVIKPIVYRALGQLQHLQSLRICYWGYDAGHSHFEVPALPRLRELTVENYLPPVYQHDFSAVLLHATRLEVLNLHFHKGPSSQTCGVYLVKLFDQLRKAKKKLRLKSFSLHSAGHKWSGEALREAIDVQQLKELNLVLSGRLPRWDETDQRRLEVTRGLRLMLIGQKLCLKSIQYDGLDEAYAHFLGSIMGLERMYLLESFAEKGEKGEKLRDIFFHAIATNHGATLRHLMLPAYWDLPTPWIAKLFRTCPNITQLSLVTECETLEAMSILVPLLRKLWAIRIRFPTPEHHEEIGKDLAEHFDFPELRYIGLGKLVWELGGIYEKDGVRKRKMKRISREDVKDVEIWKMEDVER